MKKHKWVTETEAYVTGVKSNICGVHCKKGISDENLNF